MFSIFKKKKAIENIEIRVAKDEDYADVVPVAEYFKNETGVTFEKQISILKNKVTAFCRRRGIKSFLELLHNVKHDNELKQELIDTLTTNETFFYREFKQIEELVKLVKKTDKKVDILCAPSATGEEPYSIVIALLESDIPQHSFHIVGIDINQDALDKAEKALFKERNVRNLSSLLIDKYFQKDGEKFILKDIIKSHVTFKLTNLFDSSFKNIGKFDFIFSRNMLIYFDKETKLKAKEILESMRKNPNQEIFFGHADLF
ncbi:MAG: chemotaxis protein CheR [Sulfurimonas sp. RIFOXYD12_FULL_33_39]|uniref:CheR family methyltransferase n=1 Tax=unclassified Sulfurimonas TaxID=2623549 RepID=UPI0008BDF4CA|nr:MULTISPECIES: CheR family methyltransferase [unclassified Sulfurimonas]OHE07840.1 MAG: chemotaxis protein CheR [Sulfurimonas sp. RIFCSPLOWO2_12_FULL_34_6]OHE09815.1 MAG: chemotaxis protein CheR [Sulfurimonas sp. RIFOXYD12_FULL_33_39]OHE13677.1 MAG: chemotaxis protein CheR [Sulfurimonas sp. RIFOXYD2_FULL_34_21]DAB28114.1 MAG TPA: chemotaxis protein CheR [Sulfurimonas sp. UBA10385]